MKQQRFEVRYQKCWALMEELLVFLESQGTFKKPPACAVDRSELPEIYVEICQHLAIAKSRAYSTNLIHRLHDLTLRAHHQIYKRRLNLGFGLSRYFKLVFPETLRRHIVIFWTAFLLFYGPGIVFGMICFGYPELIYTVMDDASVADMEYMYSPDSGRAIGRSDDRQGTSDFLMFGFYIYNNVAIGFQTFAGGLMAGLGTVFYLFYNGIVIGGIAGYLSGIGYGKPFWTFVSGHGAFELNAIVISGMAGLLLARAILSPGNISRINALKIAAREAVILVGGAAAMLVVAALIEAFWSPSAVVPPIGKFIFATLGWALVFGYFVFAGRSTRET